MATQADTQDALTRAREDTYSRVFHCKKDGHPVVYRIDVDRERRCADNRIATLEAEIEHLKGVLREHLEAWHKAEAALAEREKDTKRLDWVIEHWLDVPEREAIDTAMESKGEDT